VKIPLLLKKIISAPIDETIFVKQVVASIEESFAKGITILPIIFSDNTIQMRPIETYKVKELENFFKNMHKIILNQEKGTGSSAFISAKKAIIVIEKLSAESKAGLAINNLHLGFRTFCLLGHCMRMQINSDYNEVFQEGGFRWEYFDRLYFFLEENRKQPLTTKTGEESTLIQTQLIDFLFNGDSKKLIQLLKKIDDIERKILQKNAKPESDYFKINPTKLVEFANQLTIVREASGKLEKEAALREFDKLWETNKEQTKPLKIQLESLNTLAAILGDIYHIPIILDLLNEMDVEAVLDTKEKREIFLAQLNALGELMTGKNISPQARHHFFNQIPWQDFAELRNAITHIEESSYFLKIESLLELSDTRLQKVLNEDIPKLRNIIDDIITDKYKTQSLTLNLEQINVYKSATSAGLIKPVISDQPDDVTEAIKVLEENMHTSQMSWLNNKRIPKPVKTPEKTFQEKFIGSKSLKKELVKVMNFYEEHRKELGSKRFLTKAQWLKLKTPYEKQISHMEAMLIRNDKLTWKNYTILKNLSPTLDETGLFVKLIANLKSYFDQKITKILPLESQAFLQTKLDPKNGLLEQVYRVVLGEIPLNIGQELISSVAEFDVPSMKSIIDRLKLFRPSAFVLSKVVADKPPDSDVSQDIHFFSTQAKGHLKVLSDMLNEKLDNSIEMKSNKESVGEEVSFSLDFPTKENFASYLASDHSFKWRAQFHAHRALQFLKERLLWEEPCASHERLKRNVRVITTIRNMITHDHYVMKVLGTGPRDAMSHLMEDCEELRKDLDAVFPDSEN
jgi:uncharacterized protein with HEPN domain